MTASDEIRRWPPDSMRPEIAGVLVVAAVLAASAGEILFWGDREPTTTELDALGVVVLAVSGLLLFWRRRYALAVLVAVGGLAITFTALGYPPDAMLPAVVVALYTVGAEGDRATTLLIAVVVAVVVGINYIPSEGLRAGSGMVLEIFRFLFPLALGDAVRARRAYEAELLHRAEEAERTREEEAMRRVQEERLRIARDIHDVVSHSISTINVQAGVAAHLVDQDSAQAGAALETIRDTTKEALTELRSMLGVLRSPSDSAPLTPTAVDDDAFAALFAGMRNTGMTLEVQETGDAPDGPVADATRIAAYRIVQESLTNALRHGASDTVTVEVGWGRAAARIRVTSSFRTDPAGWEAGAGIIGMRERAGTLGGSLTAGPADDGETWVVDAELPYRGKT